MYSRIIDKVKGDNILYAAEVGSRARGYATKESDSDILIVSSQHPSAYLGVFPCKDAWAYQDKNVDVTEWDIRKTLLLACKLNWNLWVALRSQKVYQVNEELKHDLGNIYKENFSVFPVVSSLYGQIKTFSKKQSTLKRKIYIAYLVEMMERILQERKMPFNILWEKRDPVPKHISEEKAETLFMQALKEKKKVKNIDFHLANLIAVKHIMKEGFNG